MVAAFCALTVWLLGLFATSAELHDSLHHEAGEADHTCAVTLFRDGAENPAPAAFLPVAPVLFPAGEVAPATVVPVADAQVRLPPGCGPPLC